MQKPSIYEQLRQRILVLDGAMGSLIQEYKLSDADYRGDRFKDFPHEVKGNNDLLSITRPDVIKEIHAKYFEAGADIAETNTFSGTSIAMADYHMEDLVYELNFESAKIAKEVADSGLWFGFFARQLSTRFCTLGSTVSGRAGGISLMCAMAIAIWFSPVKGLLPLSAS